MNLEMATDAVAKTIAAVGTTAAVSYVDVSVPYIGVPLNVVVAAIGGTIAGFAWSDRMRSRRQVFGTAFGSVLAACAMTWILGMLAKHFWHMSVEVRDLAPLAIIIALFGRRWIPAVNDRIGPWLDNIPFINKSKAAAPAPAAVPKEGE
jgi:hypothetical protein